MATELQAFLESWDQEDLLLLALLYRRRKYKKYRSAWHWRVEGGREFSPPPQDYLADSEIWRKGVADRL